MTTKGDFSFITNLSDRATYEDMYAAVTKAEAWEWIKTEPEVGGFMFNNSDTMRKIRANMADCASHSGASFAFCIRQMCKIACRGWDEWVKEATADNTP